MSETRCKCGRYEVFGTPASLFDGKFHSPSICEAFPSPEVDAATLTNDLLQIYGSDRMEHAARLLSRYHITPRAPRAAAVSERPSRREEARSLFMSLWQGSRHKGKDLDAMLIESFADLLLAREDAAWNAGVRALNDDIDGNYVSKAILNEVASMLLRPEVTR